MTVTLTYDDTLSRVQITATDLPGRAALVERSLNQVRWDTVRGGLAVPIEDGEIQLDDYEFFADRLNWYRVTPNDYVAGFEVDTSGWEAVDSTFVQSTAQAFEGTGSGLQTPDGVASVARARTVLADSPPVVEGTEYELSVWVYRDAAAARDVDISVEFFDAADVSLEFTIWKTVTVTPDVWTRVAGTRAAPTGTVTARLNVNQRDTPAVTDLLHVDKVEFSPVVFPAETASITPDLADTVWLKSIRWPFLNRPARVINWSDVGRSARSGLFPVSDRSVPVSISDVRGSQQFSLEIIAETLEDERDIDLVLAAGGTYFIQVPQSGPPGLSCPDFTVNQRVPGGYVEIGDVDNSRRFRSGRVGPRFFTLPCTVVAAPAPDIIGSTMTWGAVLNLFDDWQNLIAANPTWLDLLVDVAGPEDLVQL